MADSSHRTTDSDIEVDHSKHHHLPHLLHHNDVDRQKEIAIHDQDGMLAIGKKQVFKRKFTFWTALGITFCVTSTWAAINSLSFQALVSGGPVGLLYGYILCATGMTCVTASLAEFASIWPSSGAQYHWAAELSPKRWRAEMSWIAGWATFAGGWCASILCATGTAVQIQAYAILTHEDYAASSQRWHVYLIYAAVMVLYLVINIWGLPYLTHLNIFGMFCHLGGYLIVTVVMAATTKDKHTSEYVFTSFQNNAGWSNGVAFCIAAMTSMNGFAGVESAAHFAEEIEDAPRALPRAMFWTVLLSSLISFPWMILLLYCIGDLDAVLASPIAVSSPITQVFANATGSKAAAVCMNGLTTYLAFIGGADVMGSTARTIWSMARDNAFPEPFRRVHPTLDVPIYPLVTLFITELLVGMIYIWNTTAFFGVTSGGLALYTISWGLPIGLHLFYGRRNPNIVLGPWNLGRAGYFVNIVSFVWLSFILVFLCFPIYYPVTPANMNYASLIVGFFIILSLVVYFTYGRSRFNGPIVEILLGVVPSADGTAPAGLAPSMTHNGENETYPTDKGQEGHVKEVGGH